MSPWRSLLLDFAAIAIFAAIGRSSHAEGLSLPGVLITAWPFLAGCLVGTVVARVWRLAYWPSAIVIWISTVAVGMILRVLSGPGTQLSFTIVATISLGVLFLGGARWLRWCGGDKRQPLRGPSTSSGGVRAEALRQGQGWRNGELRAALGDLRSADRFEALRQAQGAYGLDEPASSRLTE